jgi:hypothetical protein
MLREKIEKNRVGVGGEKKGGRWEGWARESGLGDERGKGVGRRKKIL